MRRNGLKLVVTVIACAAISAPADARPRLLRVIGALATAPIAVIAGAAHPRVRYHRVRDRSVSVPRRAAGDIRPQVRGMAPGWAGPLFWPNASADLFDYVFGFPGGSERFWSYGYDDILDGMFVTAGVPYERPLGQRNPARIALRGDNDVQRILPWQNLCGLGASQIDALVERIRTKLQLTLEQNAGLETVRDALVQADAKIGKACPDAAIAEAPARLGLMASRLIAIRQAASIALPPLRRFYALLDDRQKILFNAAETDPISAANASIRAPNTPCAEATDGSWPTARIARRVVPTGEQFADFERLRLTSESFGQFVTTSCNAEAAKNPVERLEAARKRVNVLRYAVSHVSPALDQAYESLNAKQKARFSSVGR